MDATLWESRLVLPVSVERDHVRGSLDAPTTLLEYGDYECPFCGAAHHVIDELLDIVGNDVRFVFRHFPLTTVHPHAELAAEAAEAAAAQGKFWEMHDVLFTNQDALELESLMIYADELDLDPQRFVDDLTSHRWMPRVREDFMSGVRSGVNGTPSFFINGQRHEGPWDLEHLRDALRRASAR